MKSPSVIKFFLYLATEILIIPSVLRSRISLRIYKKNKTRNPSSLKARVWSYWSYLNQLEISLFFSLPFVRFLARDKTFVWKSNCKSIKQMNPVTKSAKYKLRCFLEKYFIFSRRYDQILWRTWDDWQYQILKHLILELNCSFCSSATFFSSVIWYQMNLSLSSFEWISKIIEKSFSKFNSLETFMQILID